MSNVNQPLADRIRPQDFAGFFGQSEIVGKGKLLRQAIEADRVPSMIFWGPPGSGKTTLAKIIAKQTKSDFIELSAVTAGVADLREVVKRAETNKRLAIKTILFIDEIHRWNKAQQDALLPHLERGTIILIGATTENPSFEVRNALLSRCRVFVLAALSVEQLEGILTRALTSDVYLASQKIKIKSKIIQHLAELSNGDARTALNVLEYAAGFGVEITELVLEEAFQKSYLQYDKDGEEHYNLISALHKSMRGSDADAALYYLARMLEGGEDPIYIARRLVRFASEDVGLANSRAIEQVVAIFQACQFIGMPECGVNLAQAVVYLAKCEKSVEIYQGYKEAQNDVRLYGNLAVPLHIRNAPTKLMKDLNYGKGYKYSPDYNYKERQTYLPTKLAGKKYLKK
ncbi:MAG: replication-associated recombination protein A [bacterium]